MLFAWDTRRQPVEEVIEGWYDTLYSEESRVRPERDPFTAELVKGAVEHAEDIDQRISRHAEHWRIERMPGVDRNILRMAVYEMVYGATPAAVAIDEAIELARRYSNEEAAQFVNGVLDAVRKGHVTSSGGP
jgi:N utilization substance protein B